MIKARAVRWVLSAGLGTALAGCATIGAPDAAQYGDHMAAARAAEAEGSPRRAVEAYRTAVEADPARKEPWREIARIELEQRRPVEALAAAQEVLRRDPADADASMLYLDVVLQLTAEAVARMRAMAPEQREGYLARAQGLVAEAISLFGDTVVPATDRARYGSEAVERYRRNLPTAPPDIRRDQQEKAPDPLDVLGGG